jgi:NADH dehydrogenase
MSDVVILGAGFGGLATARALARTSTHVTIVDQRNYHTFQPLLYQVATAGLNAADVAYAVRGIFQRQQNVSFRQATVTGVDWPANTLVTDRGPLHFDHLVLATGSTANYFGIPGAAEHGFPLYSLSDAIALRNHVLGRFEAADADPSLVDDGALCFTVVGGGPTGVEVAGALSELFAMVLRKDFRTLDVSRARIVLVEMAPTLLQPFSPPSQRHARERLTQMGVEVRTEEAVVEVTPTRVRMTSGDDLRTHTLIWAAGVRANPLAGALGLPTARAGRVVVGSDLRVPGHHNVYAIGDCAAIEDERGELLPMLAPVAMQSGRFVGRSIARSGHNGAFHYRDKGTMATIGRRAAVAELPLHLRLSGTPAWLAWLGLHLVTLVGFRNRLSVFLNWAWNYLTWDRGPRLIVDAARRDAARPGPR